MLKIKVSRSASGGCLSAAVREEGAFATVYRRSFLRNSGLGVGGIAATSTFTASRVQPAKAAAPAAANGNIEIKKSICTHCSVGCTVIA
ncbi:MAG: hypothetical protein ACK5KM_14075, partial [Hyphomicrobiaceae bacterium]